MIKIFNKLFLDKNMIINFKTNEVEKCTFLYTLVGVLETVLLHMTSLFVEETSNDYIFFHLDLIL